MKKSFLIMFLLLVLLCFSTIQITGKKSFSFGVPIIKDRASARKVVLGFFEDIKFRSLSDDTFANFGEKNKNINDFFIKVFGVNLDKLDVIDYEIETLEFDSGSNRAKVKIKILMKNLAEERKISVPVVAFLYRTKENNWSINLQNSF